MGTLAFPSFIAVEYFVICQIFLLQSQESLEMEDICVEQDRAASSSENSLSNSKLFPMLNKTDQD